jgi:PAS domain S-box-containing protein
MAEGATSTNPKRAGAGAAADAATPAIGALATLPPEQLPPGMPPEMFTAPGMLAVADLLPILCCYVDRDEVVRFLNKPLADYLGQPREALLGRHVREMLGEETYAERKPLIAATLAGEKQLFAAEFHHPVRGSAAIQAEYVPWANARGEVEGLVMLVHDITEQRDAERALKESEERFRRIANQAPVLMWVTNLDRTRDFVNDAYMAFLGTDDREAARTYDWRTGIHPDDVERIVAESIAGEASGEPFTLEGRFRRGDGEYRWLRSTSSPRFGPDGALIGFIGAATDITLTKQSELDLKRQVEARTADLARSEAQFRAIFDTVLEVIVLLAPDGTIVEMNETRAGWRDPDPRRAIGKKVWEAPTLLAYPQHIPLMKEAVARAASGEPFRAEVRMEREGVPTAFLDYSIAPIANAAGEIVYLLTEARDITDLKAAQEQLRQSQKMEALGQLTGGIAHDFNNLLTVIVGGLDIISKRTGDDKLQTYAANALAAAERGARLTGQLLAFSRVQRLEVRPTQVAPLIESMRPLLRNVLGPGITKTFDLDTAMMAVMADPTQLEVAVLNLAINARDAMPGGGELSIASRRVAVAGDPELEDGDYIELAISDTGTGMAEDVVARAFEPFFTTKEVGKGTGLGLSMVYGMARQSGGTARIDSAPGEGTAVKLYFRSAEGAEAAEPAAGDREADRRKTKRARASILVIDDDPDVRAFIVATLDEQGYRVRQASDGREALAEIARERPDLVILDFIMPGLSGAEVANRILAEHPRQPILFVSGYSETDAVKRVAPGAPLLAKPFRAEALDTAVRGALARD